MQRGMHKVRRCLIVSFFSIFLEYLLSDYEVRRRVLSPKGQSIEESLISIRLRQLNVAHMSTNLLDYYMLFSEVVNVWKGQRGQSVTAK